MKKNNEKGFVLAEAIISAVFIMGIFTFLITNIFPLIYKYNRALNYDNPEDVYSINLYVDTLIELDFMNNIKDILNINECEYKYDSGIFNEECTNPAYKLFTNQYYKKLIDKDYLNISNVLFVKGATEIDNLKNANMTRGMREYAKYFIEQKDSSKIDDKDVGVLVRFGNAKYAGIWWKYVGE